MLGARKSVFAPTKHCRVPPLCPSEVEECLSPEDTENIQIISCFLLTVLLVWGKGTPYKLLSVSRYYCVALFPIQDAARAEGPTHAHAASPSLPG